MRSAELLTGEERELLSRYKIILLDCLLKKEPLKVLIRKAAEIFRCPVILTTSTYRVLVMDDFGYTVNDPIWITAAETGYCGAGAVALFESEGVTRQVLSSENAFVLSNGLADKIPRILQKIYTFGRVGAYIGIFQMERPFTDLDLSACDLLCEVLSVMLERSPGVLGQNQTIRDSILSDLISGDLHSATVLNDRLRTASWKPEAPFRCVLITPERSSTGIDNADYLSDLLKREILSAQVIRVPEGLLLLVDHEDRKEFPEQKLSGIAESYRLYMNVSGSFDSLSRLRDYYQLCIRIHRTAKRLHLTDRITFFEDVVFSMLTEGLEKKEKLTFSQTEYRILSAYDREHETDYCGTLLKFIECGCNITNAAGKLYLHRNTLARRLMRITEICGLSPSDGKSLIHFYITAKMHRWQ